MLWVIFIVLTLAVLAVLAIPFARAHTDTRRRADYDIVVYRSQLAEIDQEVEDGLLTTEQADAARAEVHRRMLAAEDAELARPRGLLNASRASRIAAVIAVGLVIPIGAGLMYGTLGSPKLPGKPYLWRVHNDPEFASAASTEAMLAAVEAHPSADGFAALGRTYFAARDYEQAIAAYRRAFELGTNDAVSCSEFGESLVMTNGGAVVPEAMAAFFKALADEPKSERSRFYLGLAESQIGNNRQAVAIWKDLEKTSPADAPWLAMLREHIAAYAKQGGFDPATVPASPPDVKAMSAGMAAMKMPMPSAVSPHGPTGASNSLATQLTAGERAAAGRDPSIVAMVEKLADKMKKNPGDVAGWQRLAHAYAVIANPLKAREAAERAVKLKPQDPASLLALAEAQLLAAPEGALPAEFVGTMRKVLAVDANNPQALYYVGLAESKAGNATKAQDMWAKALKTLPPGDPLAMEIHHRAAGVEIKKK